MSNEMLESQGSIGNEQPQAATPDGSQQPMKVSASAPAASAAKNEWANKTVLLVDSNPDSRESRAKIMRKMGVRVECVSNAEAARARLTAETYNLILVDLGRDIDGAKALVHGIKMKNARQLVGFLVGRPLFVATTLSGRSPRPQSAASPIRTVVAEKPSTAAADFGQNVREAEAAQLAVARVHDNSR